MNRVYYAHAMCLYGEPEEYQELAQIRRRFRERARFNAT